MPPLTGRWPPAKPPMTNPPGLPATASKWSSGADDRLTEDHEAPSALVQIPGLPASVAAASTARDVPSGSAADARDQKSPDGSRDRVMRSHVVRSAELHRANRAGSHCCPSPAGPWQCGLPVEPATTYRSPALTARAKADPAS